MMIMSILLKVGIEKLNEVLMVNNDGGYSEQENKIKQ